MQPIPGGREIAVSLRCVSVSVSPEGVSHVRCLNCKKALDVHQPDADLPYRMLATCEACKRWHLVDCDPEAPRALLTLLPDPMMKESPSVR